MSEVWSKGGEGGIELANEVLKAIELNKHECRYINKPENWSKNKPEGKPENYQENKPEGGLENWSKNKQESKPENYQEYRPEGEPEIECGFKYAYSEDLSIREKIETIAKNIYGADGVDFLPAAVKEIAILEGMGLGKLLVCMAKTQYSLSDDQKKLGVPKGFRITVKNVRVSAGAGFAVVLTGEIMTMPGLPKKPSAEKIDVDSNGKIYGLF